MRHVAGMRPAGVDLGAVQMYTGAKSDFFREDKKENNFSSNCEDILNVGWVSREPLKRMKARDTFLFVRGFLKSST